MLAFAVLFAATTAVQTAGRVAFLVESTDPAALAAELTTALDAPDPLVRATAARVAAVRGAIAVLPKLRDTVSHESDHNAAREEMRALVMLGDADDVDRAAAAARTLPAGAIDVLARAVARRGDAYDLYLAKLRPLGFAADTAFFKQSLWQRGGLAVAVSSRTLGNGNAADWRALLRALRESELAVDRNVLAVSLNASSEEIRNESVWYLVHEFADDPQKIDERVLAAVDAPADERSLREAFGRELVRRMSGLERKDDPRWLKWLQSEEADALIGSEIAFLEYFTDPEFAARKNHCDIASYDCRTPASKPNRRVIPTTAVAPPAFLLPELLPAGLADAIAREGGCTSGWLGTGQASVDTAGRVREVALNPVDMSKNCERVVSALMRLSLASPDSIATPRETSNLLFVHAAGTPVCLDEPPITARPAVTHALGEGVQAPVIKRRVEPSFPANVRLSMGEGRSVLVIMQTTISREGCVRNIRLIRQSPFPELNGAAIVAVAQWRFEPGRMRGEPVDVLFNLTINFKTR